MDGRKQIERKGKGKINRKLGVSGHRVCQLTSEFQAPELQIRVITALPLWPRSQFRRLCCSLVLAVHVHKHPPLERRTAGGREQTCDHISSTNILTVDSTSWETTKQMATLLHLTPAIKTKKRERKNKMVASIGMTLISNKENGGNITSVDHVTAALGVKWRLKFLFRVREDAAPRGRCC